MNFDELKPLISAYVDGETSEQETRLVEAALDSSEEARQYYTQLKAISSDLHTWQNENPSSDVELKIQREVFKKEGQAMQRKQLLPKGATIAVAVLIMVSAPLVVQNYLKRGTQSHPVKGMITAGLPGDVSQTTAYPVKGTVADARHASQVVDEKDKLKSRKDLSGAAETKRQYAPNYLKSEYEVARDASINLSSQSPKSDQTFFRARSKETAETAKEFAYTTTASMIAIPGKDGDRVAYYEPLLPYPVENNFNTEQYDDQVENEFLKVTENPLSTFSIDVDTASYANLRRLLNSQQTPPVGAVRIEEMVNYFVYSYPQPKGEDPFSVNIEVGKAPWKTDHLLAKIGLQGKTLTADTLPESNLVFLIDVSGSMEDSNKLPLLKTGFKMLVQQLRPEEMVSIVTYAGNAGVLLDSVSGSDKQRIMSAIDQLSAGGSTAGAQGILTAYELAAKNLIKGGNNRVILATDGDFNIGVSNDSELVKIIEEKRKQGIFLTVLGFGMGNYKDSKMEKLADKGNGNYYYIDTEREAKKVLVRELGSTLFTIAKDVKLQIEFNPSQVKAYRLIGYENRMLAKEDFNDDTKDAGELGAGHTVTALYEIIPASSEEDVGGSVDALKYQVPQAKPEIGYSDEVMTVKLRYKKPDEEISKLISQSVTTAQITESPSEDFQFSSAVAEFGMLLKNSKHKGNASFEDVLKRARAAQGKDEWGYRAELIDLVQKAQTLVPETYTTGYGFKNAE